MKFPDLKINISKTELFWSLLTTRSCETKVGLVDSLAEIGIRGYPPLALLLVSCFLLCVWSLVVERFLCSPPRGLFTVPLQCKLSVAVRRFVNSSRSALGFSLSLTFLF